MSWVEQESTDSLDLLLDTICNIFGGIILIAIMVMLISQRDRHAAQEKETTRGKDSVSAKPFDQQAEVEILRNKIRIHDQKQVQETSVSSSTKTLAQLNVENVDLEKQSAVVTKEIVEQERLAQRLQETKAKLLSEQSQLTNELARLEHKTITRTLSTPRLHDAGGRIPVFLALKAGRLYPISNVAHAFSSKSRPFATEGLSIAKEPGGLSVIEFRPEAGQVIRPKAESEGYCLQIIQNVDPVFEYLEIVVYSDSYGEFNYLKTVLVRSGLRYNWFQQPVGSAVNIGDFTQKREVQ